jgi:flagellar FliL protein
VKKIMVVLAALFILAGGAVAALKWLGIGPFAPKETAAKEAPKKPEVQTIFIDMDPIMVPLLQGNGVAATIQIQIKLETEGQENAIFLKRRMPKISDAFVRDLHAFMPRLLKDKERIDVLILKQRLQVIGDRLFGKGYIKDVLVQSVIDTPAS